MVVPMTSKSRSGQLRPPYLVAVSAAESGLSKDGWVKADQIVTIDVAQLGDRAGRLAPGKIEELDAALRFVLALGDR
jgi:mRNA-degrading endonuclease toxin of MazEF toxin-antitoxin module